jgi:DNA-directed RNA polymerase III subunit RPC6
VGAGVPGKSCKVRYHTLICEIDADPGKSYTGLTRDEHLVFACIDSSGTAGMWTKNIIRRLNAHSKVLDRTLKTLESKGIIRPMKNVKYPQRKMFIVAGLQPSEEATGGAWYTDGVLDVSLIHVIGDQIEEFVSQKSWKVIVDNSQPLTDGVNNKRKAPHDGFDSTGKEKPKIIRIDDNQPRSESSELKYKVKSHKVHSRKSYVPHDPGYLGYPTLSDITKHINTSKVTNSVFPQNSIAHLIDVMVYDDRLYAVERPTRGDEVPDEGKTDKVTMYRCFKTPPAREKTSEMYHMCNSDSSSTRKAGRRQWELEEIGRGGTSEVPCMKCPTFDLCGDGGPVNVKTCPYFDEWYLKAAKADMPVDPWPGVEEFIKDGELKKDRRLKALPAVVVKVEEKPVDVIKIED